MALQRSSENIQHILDRSNKMSLTATKVPGRNIMVTKAMAFIEELSRFAAAAISRESSAMSTLI
jgi:hypothetical protein